MAKMSRGIIRTSKETHAMDQRKRDNLLLLWFFIGVLVMSIIYFSYPH